MKANKKIFDDLLMVCLSKLVASSKDKELIKELEDIAKKIYEYERLKQVVLQYFHCVNFLAKAYNKLARTETDKWLIKNRYTLAKAMYERLRQENTGNFLKNYAKQKSFV